MGAHNFDDQAFGATAAEAFREACDEALYEEGHNAYNGTISTNHNFVLKPLKTGETLAEWRQRMLDDDEIQKWGPCGCVKDPDVPAENGRFLGHFAGWASS